MMLPLLQRAFDIARSGEVESLRDLRRQMKAEGYPAAMIDAHLSGPTLTRQLQRARLKQPL